MIYNTLGKSRNAFYGDKYIKQGESSEVAEVVISSFVAVLDVHLFSSLKLLGPRCVSVCSSEGSSK